MIPSNPSSAIDHSLWRHPFFERSLLSGGHDSGWSFADGEPGGGFPGWSVQGFEKKNVETSNLQRDATRNGSKLNDLKTNNVWFMSYHRKSFSSLPVRFAEIIWSKTSRFKFALYSLQLQNTKKAYWLDIVEALNRWPSFDILVVS